MGDSTVFISTLWYTTRPVLSNALQNDLPSLLPQLRLPLGIGATCRSFATGRIDNTREDISAQRINAGGGDIPQSFLDTAA